jgi:O-succinylbenzoate synthase
MNVVYDAGVLIAVDRGDASAWTQLEQHLRQGWIPIVPSPVVSQVSRSPRQMELHRFLSSCSIAAFEPAQSHQVGALLARADTADVVDAHLVVLADLRDAAVVTTDPDDISHLANHLADPVLVQTFRA